MAKWHVSTEDKKSVEEHEFWEKDGMTIIRITGYRWGSWIVTTTNDDEPNFSRIKNPLGDEKEDSIDMNNCYENNIEDVELESLDDGWFSDIMYPDDFLDEEHMNEIWDEDSYEGWEREGWIQTETECWISCNLICEKIEDKNEVVL